MKIWDSVYVWVCSFLFLGFFLVFYSWKTWGLIHNAHKRKFQSFCKILDKPLLQSSSQFCLAHSNIPVLIKLRSKFVMDLPTDKANHRAIQYLPSCFAVSGNKYANYFNTVKSIRVSIGNFIIFINFGQHMVFLKKTGLFCVVL